MSYAWIIDRDHLYGPGGEFEGDGNTAVGVTGPRDAPDLLVQVLEEGAPAGEGIYNDHDERTAEIFTFKMYDDDEILYYTGRMITDEGDTEDACYAPLGNYGFASGCVRIDYPGNPHMDCG